MSKNSPKQNIEQLMRWLPTLRSYRERQAKRKKHAQRRSKQV